MEMGATWLNIKGYIGPNYRNRRIVGQIARLEISPCIKILTRITNVVLVYWHYCINPNQCYPSSSDFLPPFFAPMYILIRCMWQETISQIWHNILFWVEFRVTDKLERSWITLKEKNYGTLFADRWSNHRSRYNPSENPLYFLFLFSKIQLITRKL